MTDEVAIEVPQGEEGEQKRNDWCTQQPFDRRDLDERVKLGRDSLFIFVNFLQQLAIISSAELIAFPEEWLRFFSWLNGLVLLDFLSLFDVSNDLALIFKIVVTVLIPLAIAGIIGIIAVEGEAFRNDPEFTRCWEGCCAVIFAALAISFLVVGTSDNAEVGFIEKQVFVFVGILCAVCVVYAMLRAAIVWRINTLRAKSGEPANGILEVQYISEVYVWLFIFLSIYVSVFKSALSFIALLSSPTSTSSAEILISGIVLSFLSALFMLWYTWWRASLAPAEYADDYGNYGKYGKVILTGPFEDRFWYFQVVILLDKTVVLLIRYFDNSVLATSFQLAYIFLFTLFIVVSKPYDRNAVLRAESKYLSSNNIDIFGRTSNFVLLLFVLVFNLVGADARDVLGPVTIVVSVLTGLVWLFILFVPLRSHRVVLYKIKVWRFRAIWAGKNESRVKELVQNRSEPFQPTEAEALTNTQCLWVVRHCLSIEVRSSALSYQRDWSLRNGPSVRGTAIPYGMDSERKELEQEDVQKLCEALLLNRTLARLDLTFNDISKDGPALGHCLAKNTALTELILISCSIKDDGAEAIGRALVENETLRKLDLWFNLIGDDGAKAIGDGLKKNTALRALMLEYNGIGSDGAKALANMLTVNKTLTALYLGYNGIGTTGAGYLAEQLESNTTIKDLDLRRNKIDDDGAAALGQALEVNGTLEFLDLGSNKITDAGAKAIGRALTENKASALEVITLSENSDISTGVREQLRIDDKRIEI